MTATARDLIRSAVAALVREGGGEMVTRPMFRDRPDAAWTREEPEPLAGISAALLLRYEIAMALASCARYAREDGRTWAEIGAVLYEGHAGMTPATRAAEAFRCIADRDLGSGQSFAWTCPACRKIIIDRGPEAGHPADAEQGHAGECGRLAETVRTWEAQRGGG